MARGRTGLAAARRVAAGAFLFGGVFVMCFGLGNSRQALVITGAAIAALAFTARLATNVRRNPRRWVRGTGYVIEATEPPPDDSRFGRSAIQLTVDAPGLPQETVTVHDSRVPVGQWPRPGQELPIQVAADDVRQVRILWHRLVTSPTPAEPAWDPGPGWEAGPGEPEEPVPAGTPAGTPAAPDRPADDQIDFDLDGPPTITLAPVPGTTARSVPRPRPSPRPRRRPEPVPAGAVATGGTSATGATAAGETRLDDLVTTYPSAHPGPAGAINGVGVTLLVSDLPQSVAFYRDQLGFYEVDGGEGSTVLASGETRLVLRQASDLGSVTRRLVHLNLEVADVDAMYAELKAAGIRFLYPPRPVSRSARLELWAASFRDPDGHGIALTQWRPRAED